MRKIRIAWLLAVALLLSLPSAMAQSETKYAFMGKGTEADPFLIGNKESLAYLGRQMEAYENYTKGYYFKLTADIVLNEGTIIDESGCLVADTTQLEKWSPMGTEWYGKPFMGVFDGDGHAIIGMYVDGRGGKADGYHGLFGKIQDAVVKNLTIKNSFICGYGQIGALAGWVAKYSKEDGWLSVVNCHNYATVEGCDGYAIRAGGLVGNIYDCTMEDCTNHGRVSIAPVPNQYGDLGNCGAGGISGSDGFLKNCINYGPVESVGYGVAGGIAGWVQNAIECVNYGSVSTSGSNAVGGIVGSNSHYVTRCINEGELYPSEGSYVGGICGRLSWNGSITGCTNKVDLEFDMEDLTVGGICGYSDASQFVQYSSYSVDNLKDCVNEGRVTISCQGLVGGICGSIKSESMVLGCVNKGEVASQKGIAGGIAASAGNYTTFRNCQNYGSVKGVSYVAGICTKIVYTVYASGCVNFGHISTDKDGSFVGGIASVSDGGIIDCANVGTVEGGIYTGGIVGISTDSHSSIYCCYNAGDVSTRADGACVGGISGSIRAAYDCYNIGTVASYGNNCFVAGIAGGGAKVLHAAFNAGEIYRLGSKSTIGNLICNYSTNYGHSKKGCYYLKGMTYGVNVSDVFATAVTKEELKAAVQGLGAVNKDPFYGTSYWSEGYYHPVLGNYYTTTDSHRYTVQTLQGEDAVLDLGRPFDNTVFRTDAEGLALLCCNVADGANNIERFCLVDGAEFSLDNSYSVGTLTFTRSGNKASTLCLPFGFGKSDFCAEPELCKPTALQDGKLFVEEVQEADAGEAVILKPSDTEGFVKLTKADVVLCGTMPTEGLLTGVFEPQLPTQDDYVYDSATNLFVKAGDTAMLPFSAYLKASDSTDETIAVEVGVASGIQAGFIDRDADASQPARVFGIDGKEVSAGQNGDGSLPHGIYILRSSKQTRKIMR